MALWCRVAAGIDLERWAEAERELREGVRRVAAALPRARRGTPAARAARR